MISKTNNNIPFRNIDVVHNIQANKVAKNTTIPRQAVQVVINSIDEAAKKLANSETNGVVFVREIEADAMKPGGKTGFIDRFKLILSGYNNETEKLQNKILKLDLPARSEKHWTSLDRYSLKMLYNDLSEKIIKSFESSIKLS